MRYLALVTLCLTAATATAQNARLETLIGPTAPDDGVPVVGSHGNVTVAAYNNQSTDALYVVTSNGGGTSWSAPIRIDDGTIGNTKYLEEWSVGVNGTDVIVAWDDQRTGKDEIYFCASTDGGLTWSVNTFVDPGYTGASTADVKDWDMCVSQGANGTNVFFLISIDPPSGSDEELYLVANDPTVALDALLPAVHVPSIAPGVGDVEYIGLDAEGDSVVVVWDDDKLGPDDVFLNVSTDRGQTFPPLNEVMLDTDPANPLNDVMGEAISVDMVGSTIAVLWHQENTGFGAQSLRYAVSTDGGATFATDIHVGGYIDGTDDVDRQAIAINPLNPANVIAVWADDRINPYHGVFTAASMDYGATWGPDTNLGGNADFPRILFGADGTAGIAYSLDLNDTDIEDAAVAYTQDNGTTWATVVCDQSIRDTDYTGFAFDPILKNFIVVWRTEDAAYADQIWAGGYSVAGGGSVTFRNSGSNPASYSCNAPVLGGPLIATVDLAMTGHNLAALFGYPSYIDHTLSGGQVVLVNPGDPNGELLAQPFLGGSPAQFTMTCPTDPFLVGVSVYTQALHITGAVPFALTNARDLIIGAF